MVKTLKIGIRGKRNPWSDNTHMFQLARRVITSNQKLTMTTFFFRCFSCGNTTQQRRNIDRCFNGACNGRNNIFIRWFCGKKMICFPDVDGGLTSFDDSKKAARLNKTNISNRTTDKIRRNPESQIFCGLALVFNKHYRVPLKVLVDNGIWDASKHFSDNFCGHFVPTA